MTLINYLLLNRFDKKTKDTAALQRQVNQLETQVNALTGDLARVTSERDRFSSERKVN